MMAHVESIHFKGALVHTCPICQETFVTKNSLWMHKKRKHKTTFKVESPVEESLKFENLERTDQNDPGDNNNNNVYSHHVKDG